LAFEDADRHASSGIHDLADQFWLSTTPTPELVADFRFRKSAAADKIHDSLPLQKGEPHDLITPDAFEQRMRALPQ
jgi:hypothetical protein